MNNTYRIVYTDPETGETEVFRPQPATTDERLDRIIELLEQAVSRLQAATVLSAADLAADAVRILNEQTGVRR